jgi:hypothetical protein
MAQLLPQNWLITLRTITLIVGVLFGAHHVGVIAHKTDKPPLCNDTNKLSLGRSYPSTLHKSVTPQPLNLDS